MGQSPLNKVLIVSFHVNSVDLHNDGRLFTCRVKHADKLDEEG